MNELTVAAVQMKSALGQLRANVDAMRSWIERAAQAGAHLVFFPECSVTGYSSHRACEVAVDAESDEVTGLERAAASRGIALGYGFIERHEEGERPYITYVVASAEGRLVYRKCHLGSRERTAFTAGDELVAARIAGVHLGVQLCWEGHIPDVAATLRAQGAELILAPHASGLGGARRVEAWSHYLPARALDNGLFVIACNALKNAQDSASEHLAHSEGKQTDKAAPREGTATGGGMAAYDCAGRLMASYEGPDERLMLVRVGGTLPRETPDDTMRGISYFDRRRPELYSS